MNRILLIALSILIAMPVRADVTVPTGTPKRFNGEDWNRQIQYKVGSIYFGDGSSNTMRVLAPDLADDLTIFKLPATNGASGQALVGDGAGALSYADVLTATNTATVTNKDYDGGTASNSLRITVPKNTKTNLDGLTRKEATVVYASDEDKLYVDNGVSLSAVGSGPGGGVENFITNGRIEDSDISAFTTYDDGASATPVNCTGGSPSTLTVTRNTSSPISELADLKIAKSAADGQGEGVAFTVTLPANNNAAVAGWQAAFDMMVRQTTNYVASDMGVYVYDVTNATTPVLITNIAKSTQTFTGPWSWSTSGTSASYRICLHVQTTSALAYDTYVDNVYAGIEKGQPVPATPAEYLGSVFTTVSNNGSKTFVVNNKCWRRADMLNCTIFLDGNTSASSSAATTSFFLVMPTGMTINTAKLNSAVGVQGNTVGAVNGFGLLAASQFGARVPATADSTTQIKFVRGVGTAGFVRTSDLNTTDDIDIIGDLWIPIAEWDSSSLSSSSTPEFACYDGSATSFGVNGCLIPTITALNDNTTTDHTITLQGVLPDNFAPSIEVLTAGGDGVWQPVDQEQQYTGLPQMYTGSGASRRNYGIGVSRISSSKSSFNVRFGNAGTVISQTFVASISYPQSAGDRYRVRLRNKGSLTFAMAANGRAGLVEPYSVDSEVHAGSYTSTWTNFADFTSVTASATCTYLKIGKGITVGCGTAATNTDSTRHIIDFTLPFSTTNTASIYGTCSFANGISTDTLRSYGGYVTTDTTSSEARCIVWPPATSGAGVVYVHYSYLTE